MKYRDIEVFYVYYSDECLELILPLWVGEQSSNTDLRRCMHT